MKSSIQLFLSVVLLGVLTFNTFGQSRIRNKGNSIRTGYVSLEGQMIHKGNRVNRDGNIHKLEVPLLRISCTRSPSPKGTILLFPGGGYKLLKLKEEGEKVASFLNEEGFDVALLEYHIGKDSLTRSMALKDALKAFRLLRTNGKVGGLRSDRLAILGIASGGHLAARTVQRLGKREQPDDVVLISPSNLDETGYGTVFPAVIPPLRPKARLFASFSVGDNPKWIKSCEEYTKTWRGFDGSATYFLLPDSVYLTEEKGKPFDLQLKLAHLLKVFLDEKPGVDNSGINPATIAVAGSNLKRHTGKLALAAIKKFDLIMIGNSITNNFENPKYEPVWNQFFAPRNALNLGYSGYRTENLIWNIQNGELDGQSPKVIIIEIGTNNVDEKNYTTRHTAGQLAGGIGTIVKLLREKCPESKIIVMRCFPGCYGGPNPTSHRMILERASDLVSRLADGKSVFYCDVNHVFLNMDGSINHDRMSDWLHPTPAGAKAWAQAMEPLLSELMDDKSLDSEIPANTAIVPVSKLEKDSYNWLDRHIEVLHIKDSINPEIVLIGNSITHFWGGEPALKYSDGRPRKPNGPNAWASAFGNHRVLNLGFGWDRTQNVLWRLDHGELDGIHPRKVVILIGTNNTSQTQNARMNTPAEIVEGIQAICGRVRSKVPGARIILMAILPREQSPTNPRRIMINEINRQLKVFAQKQKITLVDIGPKMLAPDGTLPKEIAGDFCHPTEKGYQIWADGIRSLIDEP